MKPVLTVIVAAHNNATDLPRCLDALVQQTLTSISILCIDDGSTDDTHTILQAYAQKHPNITVLHNPQAQGLASVRNQGIDACVTPFLMFCDADDFYMPNTCQLLYEAITTHDTDIAVGEIRVIYHAHHDMKISDDNYYTLKYYGLQSITKDLIFTLDLSSDNKIYRKSILDQYNIRCPVGKHFEDAYLNTAYLAVSKSIYFVNQPVYNYIRHSGSIMSNTWSKKSGIDYSIEHLDIAFALYDFFAQHQLFKNPQNTEIFWHAFRDLGSLAVNHSKSHANTKRAQKQIRTFIAQHADSFHSVDPQLQSSIRYYARGSFHSYLTRLKRFFIKFMPTYRLATENIQRLRTIEIKYQQLLEKINQLQSKE